MSLSSRRVRNVGHAPAAARGTGAFRRSTEKAFLALDAQEQKKLEADFLTLIDECNTATDGSMRVPSEYVEVLITQA